MTKQQIISARRLNLKGLTVQEIAYRLGIDIVSITNVLVSKSYIDTNGNVVFR